MRTWYPFCEKQFHSLGRLSAHIVEEWGILPFNVVGHSDISWGKSDPGVLFPWGRLYTEHRVGAWLTEDELNGKFAEGVVAREPLPQGVSDSFFLCMLQEYGYSLITDTRGMTKENEIVLSKFRMHFSANQEPESLSKPLNPKDMAWAHGLTTKYPRLK